MHRERLDCAQLIVALFLYLLQVELSEQAVAPKRLFLLFSCLQFKLLLLISLCKMRAVARLAVEKLFKNQRAHVVVEEMQET